MPRKLSAREKRVLMVCSIAAVLILLFMIIDRIAGDWRRIRTELREAKRQVSLLKMKENDPQTQRQMRMLEMVPVIELPQPDQVQGPLFHEAFTEQIKKAGLNPKTIQLTRGRASRTDAPEYLVLHVESRGRGQYEQILNLLAELPKIPQYVGVQKLSLKPDAKDRQQMDWELMVYTYASR